MSRVTTPPERVAPGVVERSGAGRPRDPRALVFGRLTVRRMPGITDGGYTLDGLAAGVNIIHGPNASGKTTTARALDSLLWPRASAPRIASLDASFHLDGSEWRVEVEGQTASYQCDGRDADQPVLPPAETRDRYHLSLHELLGDENAPFAAEIMRESAGGYDLARAAASLNIKDSPSRRVKEAEALRDARARLQEAQSAVEALRQNERRLDELREELEAARSAAARAALLERAIEYADAVAAEREAAAAVAAFPPELASLHGNETERLGRIRERLAEVERHLTEAESKRRRAEAELRDAGLQGEAGEAVVDDVVLGTLRAELASLRALEQTIAGVEAELAKAARREVEERGRIGEVIDEVRLRGLDVVELDELAEFAETAGWVRAAQAAARARLEVLGNDEWQGADPERLGRGILLLQQWLSAGGADDGGAAAGHEGRVRTLGAIAAGALALAGIAALAGGLLPAGAALVPLLAGVVLLVLILRAAPTRPDPRGGFRSDYERLGLEAPSAWTAARVAELVDRLETLRAEARLAGARAAERERVARELEEVDDAWAGIEAERAELAARFGVAPELDPSAFYLLANRINRWQDAVAGVAEREAELEHHRGRYAEAIAGASARLAPFGYDEIGDPASFGAAIDDLAARLRRHREALNELRHAEERIDAARKELETLVAERRAVFERVGLDADGDAAATPPGGSDAAAAPGATTASPPRDPEAVIHEWCALLADYRETLKELQGAEAVRREAWEKLAATPGYEPGLEDRAAEELRAELVAARETAAKTEELNREIAAIETGLDQAREGHAVEAALAEVERCEAALREAREREIRSVVGHALVEYLRRATRDLQRPAVFRRANELLAQITRGAYELDVEEGAAPSFRAIDRVNEKGLSLDDLSSATRVQLLLAVRIAFVESQEGGARLPLILDETLGNSDDDRARAIMEAAVALAAAGRQIFYFTAQLDEVAKWRSLLSQTPDLEWAVFDLAAARGAARHEALPLRLAEPATLPEPPAPGDLSHAEYGQVLLVPGIDPFTEPGSVHLWHLVEETACLHRLLTLRLETWGQLRTFVEHGGGDVLGDDATAYPRIRAAARALEAALELARIGRGRPVDRTVIEMSGAVSETFMERATQLIDELRGDAARIVEAIGKLPRFHARKARDLHNYLEENGYLDTREPLTPEELRARVFAEVGGELEKGMITAASIDRIIAQVLPEGAAGDA